MDFPLAALAVPPSLALGSFLNVVAVRVPERRSLVFPGSACPSCRTPIAWYDNIPIVSYFVLRGRCRSCSARIGVAYPLVELVTALLLVACLFAFGRTPDALIAAFFCAVLVAVSVTDLKHRIIPNVIVLPAAGVVLVVQTLLHPSAEWAVGALGAGFFLFVAAISYPGGMGMGDVKLALLLGAMLGRSIVVALMLGMLTALVPAAVLFFRHGSAARKMAIPFGPFLAAGALAALFAGERLLDAYLELM